LTIRRTSSQRRNLFQLGNSVSKILHYPDWRIDSVASFLQFLSPPIFFPPSFRQTLADPNVSGAASSRWINDTTGAILRRRNLISSPLNCRRHLARTVLFFVCCHFEEICNKKARNSSFVPPRKYIDYHLSNDSEYLKIEWLLCILPTSP